MKTSKPKLLLASSYVTAAERSVSRESVRRQASSSVELELGEVQLTTDVRCAVCSAARPLAVPGSEVAAPDSIMA